MCYMPWHLPWKLNLLNCCLESHTSINWRGSVDIWLSDISRGDGLLQPRQHICGSSTNGLLNTAKIITAISLMQAPMKKCSYWNSGEQIWAPTQRQASQNDFKPTRFPFSQEWLNFCACLHRFLISRTSSFSALCRSRHSSVMWLKSTLFMGTLMSPMASCLEKRSKSYTVMTSVFPPSST